MLWEVNHFGTWGCSATNYFNNILVRHDAAFLTICKSLENAEIEGVIEEGCLYVVPAEVMVHLPFTALSLILHPEDSPEVEASVCIESQPLLSHRWMKACTMA